MAEVAEAWYRLRDLCEASRFDEAERCLRAHPEIVTATNRTGETVLHWLAVENHLAAVAWLHANGFALTTGTKRGVPMFFEVAFLGYRELLAWLAERIDVQSLRDGDGNDVFAYLSQCSEDRSADFLRSLPGLRRGAS